MARVSFSLLVLGWCFAVSVVETLGSLNEPTVVDLNGHWEFSYTAEHKGRIPPAEAFLATMPVPGCWDDQFDRSDALRLWPEARFNPNYQPVRLPLPAEATTFKIRDSSLPFLMGTGWYRRQLEVPPAWQGRQITLQVGRVVMEAWVYVNGREVHHHLGHSTHWEVPLAPYLAYGHTNELVIAVDNTRTDRVGCSIRGYKGRSAGIFGPVAMRLAGRTRIADLYVYSDQTRLNWQLELQGELLETDQVRWHILDPNTGQIVDRGVQKPTGERTHFTSDLSGLRPWSDRRAELYQLEVGLYAGEVCLDVHRQPFGVRRLTTDGTGLRLNGHPIYLRGVCDIAYFPLTCTPPLEPAWYREHIRRLKQIGFNWIRCHTWVPPEPYLQAADELGMLIQVEPPTGYTLPEWRDILRACRKHPSVVIYCCGNEELLDEAKIEYLRQCAAELRTMAPDALFNPQEALRGVEYVWNKSDLGESVAEPFPHNPTRLAKLKEFSDVFGQYTWAWMSYGSLCGDPDKIDQRLAMYERPCLTHELGISGSYIDLSLESRYQNLRIGPGLHQAARQALSQAGLLDRHELYHRNAVAWQRLMLKNAMETARRSRLFAGYDLLGANDCLWLLCGYHCGLLNEFDELKPGHSVDDILSYNGESVLLISQQQERNLVAAEPLRRDVYVSWFGEETLEKADLRWSLTAADGNVLARGTQAIAPVDPGNIASIASIDAATPKLDRPIKATLAVELLHSGGRLQNQWDYWLFPSGESSAPQNVRVVTVLDRADVERLAGGERVVLLGGKPFPVEAMTFQICQAGRAHGHFATVLARHPLTDPFPHEGFCSWQFSKMFAGAAAVQLDALSEAFDPILEVVGSYKLPRKQAAIFEWCVGKGRLLVCSLGLPDSDPAAAWFHRHLLSYASGEQFQPKTHLTPERLSQFMNLAPSPIAPSIDANRAAGERGQLPKEKE